MMMLDTATLLWWTLDPDKLSRRASEECKKIQNEGAIISSISIWELGIKIKKKKLEIPISLETYVDKLNELKTLEIIAVDENIWLKNLALDWAHPDPADRTIVATAEIKGVPIITKDNKIREFYLNSIW
jgi:PIN domain nuclease of toxin-antitoxin system